MKPALILLFCLLAPPALAATVYQWKDAEGRTHYSDAPPPEARDVRPLRGRTQPEAPAAPPAVDARSAKPRTQAEKELEFRKRRTEGQESAEKAAKEEALAAQRRDDCRSLRNNLAGLQGGERMTRINDKGEREYIDDAQRQAEIERARQRIEQNCK